MKARSCPAFRANQPFELRSAGTRELALIHAGLRVPIVVRGHGVQDGTLWQIEGAVMIVETGEAARHHRATVIATPARK